MMYAQQPGITSNRRADCCKSRIPLLYDDAHQVTDD